ncbi:MULTISPECIES: DAK2 domain-containing protein [unclassified Arthrobacter]|uniref:DAK2 domain-containing protein n=1 Tax=unclassified Arthrobacter TaxID=235627 RepID=UPI001E5F86D2|nr:MULTISPECIES: DAK2 domain-containing protein [unclassified Arthrobacter]MCC9145756.1 DAK2 domain-containing protein [Arthrobacter sp. zg-Y919]MDK1276985.1 DAK2 domain-containing protein [Arthrobacter sp. zg.Y919]MDM7989622.1 DAK2 domain-containing protein [Arthrobacter sp. zg-Y877]WIB04514.1 DAK2 domain-containing protein [Arthrobacter sp. zg-Y919]
MKRWLSNAEVSLGNHSDRLNAINIFPVADGDTGTNLYLTLRAASSAAAAADTSDIGELLGTAGRAAMESARGNSGTLFSVFLTAMAEPLAGATRLSAPLLASSMQRAQLRSWSVLSDPVPGTMLSVLEAAAHAASDSEAAVTGDDSNVGLALTLRAMMDAALAAVIHTESQLDALTRARVVDAGGVGFLLVLDALRAAALGEELQEELLDGLHGYDVQDPHIHAHMPRMEGVEVMCTITLSPLDAATLRLQLDELGDSVIMSAVSPVGDGYRWRIHVHTPDAGTTIDLLRSLGEPQNLTITELSADGHETNEIPGAHGL